MLGEHPSGLRGWGGRRGGLDFMAVSIPAVPGSALGRWATGTFRPRASDVGVCVSNGTVGEAVARHGAAGGREACLFWGGGAGFRGLAGYPCCASLAGSGRRQDGSLGSLLCGVSQQVLPGDAG